MEPLLLPGAAGLGEVELPPMEELPPMDELPPMEEPPPMLPELEGLEGMLLEPLPIEPPIEPLPIELLPALPGGQFTLLPGLVLLPELGATPAGGQSAALPPELVLPAVPDSPELLMPLLLVEGEVGLLAEGLVVEGLVVEGLVADGLLPIEPEPALDP